MNRATKLAPMTTIASPARPAFPFATALVIGAGSGISAAVARGLSALGVKVGLAARNVDKLAGLAKETGARTFAVDAGDAASMEALFDHATAALGDLEVVLYNASARAQGPLADLDPAAVAESFRVTAFGGFLAARQAARRMVPRGRGALLFTGASASVKGYPRSAPFAMGKFALRGLAQSAARELGPKGIHVAHVVIDGAVRSEKIREAADRPDSTLDPEAIARTYLDVLAQPRSAWSFEVEMRPWVETF
jgi:NAD(P)-dependent dehydrogenase (short-subunit alcohol dehydrogenase family)